MSDDNVVLSVSGRLATDDGAFRGKAKLRRKFFPEINTRVDVGAKYESDIEQLSYGASGTAAKGSHRTVAAAVADRALSQWCGVGGARRRGVRPVRGCGCGTRPGARRLDAPCARVEARRPPPTPGCAVSAPRFCAAAADLSLLGAP